MTQDKPDLAAEVARITDEREVYRNAHISVEKEMHRIADEIAGLKELLHVQEQAFDADTRAACDEIDRLRALLNEVVNAEPFSGPCDDCFWCDGPHTPLDSAHGFAHEPQCFITRATAALNAS